MGSVEIDLGRMAGALVVRQGLPRCDWECVGNWIGDHVPEDQRDAAWTAASKQWLWRMRNVLEAGYRVEESPRVLMLAVSPANALCERALDMAEQYLPGIASAAHPGKHVVLCFVDSLRLRAYMSDFPDVDTEATAVCIRDGIVHVAVLECVPNLSASLVRELMHVCTSHLGLPRWLDEGLAWRMARTVAPGRRSMRQMTMQEQYRWFWSERDLDLFLSGESFRDQAAGWSHVLAEHLVDRICRLAGERPYPFLREARATDGGRAAAQAHLGRSLESIVEEVLA